MEFTAQVYSHSVFLSKLLIEFLYAFLHQSELAADGADGCIKHLISVMRSCDNVSNSLFIFHAEQFAGFLQVLCSVVHSRNQVAMDIHCHLIPGVDDGAQDLEETRKLLRMEYEQGVRNIIATPHYRDQMFDTPIRTVRSQFALVEKCVQEFNQELAKEDRMRIYLGCEFHANMQMSRMLDEGRVSTMADSGYVLVEFSGNAEYSYIEDRLRSLIIVGYRPIIAHVERCDNLWGDLELIRDLAQMGAYIRVNADSILGKSGFYTKRFCRKLMK